MRRHFYPEKEYRRFIIGRFQKPDFVPSMLETYSNLAIDSPKISQYEMLAPWTIIPCPADTVSRSSFLDLVNWLSQDGEEAFALALHPRRSYFVRRDWSAPAGDAVLIAFSDGTIAKWFLPAGFINDEAYTMLRKPTATELTILPIMESTEAFLTFIGAEELLDYFQE